MASQQQTNTNSMAALGEMGLWMGSMHVKGYEAQMARKAAWGLGFGSKLSERVALQNIDMALYTASTRGVFNRGAISAASRLGIRSSLAKIALSRVGGLVFTGLNVAMMAPMIYSGVKGLTKSLSRYGRDTRGLEFGKGFSDSEGSYTARQRAVRAITSSRYAARAAIGSEAQLMHR